MKYVDIKAVLQLARNITSDAKTLTSNAEELRSRLSALEGTFHDDGFEEVNAYSQKLIAGVSSAQESLNLVVGQLIDYANLLILGKGETKRETILGYGVGGTATNGTPIQYTNVSDITQSTGSLGQAKTNDVSVNHVNLTSANQQMSIMNYISSWLGDINPRYYDPFLPPDSNPYHVNCGSCAFAVDQRLDGNQVAVASHVNIGTDAEMEGWTGKRCTYMTVSEIEHILISRGAGAHLIVGINRTLPSGRSISGHWFNAVYDGSKIYTVDGQSGEIMDWPHDYGYISDWCALV